MRRSLSCRPTPGLGSACAMPRVGGAPVAPVERAWAVPTLELYQEWWAETESVLRASKATCLG